MNTIRQLMIWGDVNEFEWDRIDFKYGDKLFTDGETRDKVYGTIE